MPRPCHATTMHFWKREFSRPRHSTAWAWHVWISIGHPETVCGRICRRSASSGYHAEFHEGCYQKHTTPLNRRTISSDISGYHADFHEGHGTVGEWQGRGMAWHGRGKAWARYGMCELTLRVNEYLHLSAIFGIASQLPSCNLLGTQRYRQHKDNSTTVQQPIVAVGKQ
jgi:hypothetical protein